jgi:HAD superfamily hydrolase (TIGR01459 family)
MTRLIDSISQIANQFDAIILDQWGVLHDGTTPYAGAVTALTGLANADVRLGVLSNSGKRADLNAKRISDMGFAPHLFDCVMTSGEALWQDAALGKLRGRRAFAVCAAQTVATDWAVGLDITLVDDLARSDFVLIMGLPEGRLAPTPAHLNQLRDDILAKGLPVYCSNPDRTSPREGGALAVSPGALAHAIKDAGGDVTFYGKPHGPVFRAVQAAMNVAPERCLMVGDSLEHDIGGAAAVGWRTLFVRGGIDAAAFQNGNIQDILTDLIALKSATPPDFSIQTLR